MSASMAEALAKHVPTAASGMFNFPNGGGNARYCSCGERFDVLFTELDDDEDNTTQRLNAKLAAHQADALAAAGYGKLPDQDFEYGIQGERQGDPKMHNPSGIVTNTSPVAAGREDAAEYVARGIPMGWSNHRLVKRTAPGPWEVVE